MPDISLIKGICDVLSISANVLLGIETEHKVIENNDISMEKEIRSNMFAEPLVLEFGSSIIPCIVEGLKADYLNQCRKELVRETGILIPMLRLRDNVDLGEDEARILSYDKVLWSGNLYSVEAVYETLIKQVKAVCKEYYDEIINKECVKVLIDCLKADYPAVVEGLVPEKISYLQVENRLKEVFREKGNIRDLIHILEEMEETLII